MKRILPIFFILFASTAAMGQSLVTVTGSVLSAADSSALVGAVISINEGQLHTLVGAKGHFLITEMPRGKQARIDITYLGFEPLAAEFTPTSSPYSLDTIFMAPLSSLLDAVVVSAPIPMAVQLGDTTQFNAAAFKTNPDADADELVIKMPGIVIQEGKIEAQGEPVRRIYVDGKLFFGTDVMAALKSIPADAVESVQVFDELTEQARLAGIEDGETRKALNIITKARAHRHDIVRLEASAGHDLGPLDRFRYLAGGNYSHIEDKSRLTVTGVSNNVSTLRFGQDDQNNAGEVDSNGNPRNQQSGIQNINSIGGNYSFDNKKLRFSGSYFYNNKDVDLWRKTVKNFYPTTNNQGQQIDQVNHITDLQHFVQNNHRLDFRLEWHLSEKDVFILSPNVSYTDTDYSQASKYTWVMKNGDSTRRTLSHNPQDLRSYYLSGNAMFTHRFEKKGRNVSASLTYSLSDRHPDKYVMDEYKENFRPARHDWMQGGGDLIENYYQTQTVDNNSLRLRLSYSEPVSVNHRVIVNAIAMNEWNSNDTRFGVFNPATEKYDSLSTRWQLGPKALHSRNYAGGGGLGYSYVRSRLTFYADMNYQRIFRTLYVTEPYQNTTRKEIDDLQPGLSLRYSLQKKKYLRLRYYGRTVLPDINRMQDYVDRTNPNTWYEGNPGLQSGYRHSFDLFYNASNQKRGTNFTLTLTAAAISNYITSSTSFINPDSTAPNQSVTLIKWLNLDGYYMAGAAATYSIPVKTLRSNLNLTLDYRYSRVPSMYKVLNYGGTSTGNLRVGLTSNISPQVDFNFYSSTFVSYTGNSALSDTHYINQNLSYSLNLIFWKGLVFNTLITWKYYYTSISDYMPNNQLLVNAGIGKKFLKRQNGELRLTVYDCLNKTRNMFHYVQSNSIDDVESNALGRYALLRFTYRFNSMWNRNKPALPPSAVKKSATGGTKRIDTKNLIITH
ncbi:collagen-binding protein [Bacteroidia bacterium]|nr:collagen-binding protein [Bacteroidia bacterium]